ncbi:hypothetical protein [Stenotrophomonas maltophilia]|uniref:hypothetical protein n=1 Tax=Stenotrophomonas maltophilia TaxID=40324 RepID=UPI001FA75832|nr:hypothetical protein [Stenotrophomonas maltophilia]
MTQEHISHPEGVPNCAAGHRARHIHDKRCASAGGGHLVECACRATSKSQDPEKALAEWRRINRPARSARKAEPVLPDNVLQLPLLATPREVRRVGG